MSKLIFFICILYIIFFIFVLFFIFPQKLKNNNNIFLIIVLFRNLCLIFDYIYFSLKVFSSIFVNFYYYVIDILNGRYLSNEYTETDLDSESVFVENIEFSEEEYFDIYIRVLCYVRLFFFYINVLLFKIYYYFFLKIIRQISLFFLIFKFSYLKQYFGIFLKLGIFEFLVKKYLVFFL